MRHALILVLCLAMTPLAAQQTGTPEDIEEGVDLLSEGARRLLRGLMGEVEPQMQEMAEALKEWNFNGIGIDDLGQYHPPEKLPNGDIIIRRKTPLDVPMDDEIEI
ncbi:AAA+ family ATPase [Maribius pontilimi]|uniref:AAA+ family ATPase n=1 Tax=Palleronia pontilimi TaxID=1964209 RepID=A0A934IAY0_9RHOB|nr:AAA+ family ATPase [Palleronia pontilimi]MBJ3762291.1 AAA+ family ATPase [Palleronia pontilimi]